MENLLETALTFINRWSTIFYAVGAMGLILYLLRAREAARQRRFTPFPIEREEATVMLRDSLLILVILAAILATTFYIDRVLLTSPETARDESTVQRDPTPEPTSPVIGSRPTLAATLSAEATAEVTGTLTTDESEATQPATTPDATQELAAAQDTATPTPQPTAVNATPGVTNTPTRAVTEEPTNTPSPQATQPTQPPTQTMLPTNTPAPTATPQATPIPTQPPLPTATIAPTQPPPPPPVPAANCNTPGVRISAPAHGQTVNGNLSIIGTASIDGFQFYKLEFGQGGSPGSFAAIGDIVRQPVIDGFLAAWPASSFPSGIWTLRLTVVDQTGNFPPPCDIRVVVP